MPAPGQNMSLILIEKLPSGTILRCIGPFADNREIERFHRQSASMGVKQEGGQWVRDFNGERRNFEVLTLYHPDTYRREVS